MNTRSCYYILRGMWALLSSLLGCIASHPCSKPQVRILHLRFSGMKENTLPPECFTHTCICPSVSRATFCSSSVLHFCYKHLEKKILLDGSGDLFVLVAKRNCQRAIPVSLICISHFWWIWNGEGICSWFLSFSLQTWMAKHFFLEKSSVTLEICTTPAPTSIFVCRCAVYI